MRNKEKEEIPLVNIERHPLILILSIALSALVGYTVYRLFSNFNPWGFALAAPAVILLFQSLWLILNPFAIIFETKLEIKQSFFHQKDRYFIDIKSIALNKKGKIYITYHDDEIERINVFGIRTAHTELMKSEVEKMIVKPVA